MFVVRIYDLRFTIYNWNTTARKHHPRHQHPAARRARGRGKRLVVRRADRGEVRVAVRIGRRIRQVATNLCRLSCRGGESNESANQEGRISEPKKAANGRVEDVETFSSSFKSGGRSCSRFQG
eukprot:8213694-Pyramimonas_sp.AAC.1